MQFIKKNGFILALLAAVVLAWLFPELGAPDGVLQAGLLGKAGVMVIFLLQGLTLRTRELTGGLKDVRLHAFVQGWIFLGSALFHIAAALILRALGYSDLAAGFLYLALLPTTITSAILFTSAGGGNVPGAIFNTTLSNIVGVFWVPMGCLLLFAADGGFPVAMVGPLLVKIAKLILLPLVIGQLARPFVFDQSWFKRISPSFKYVNHSIILFIVFTTLSDSFLSHAWAGTSAGALMALIFLTAGAVLGVHAAVWISSSWVASRRTDRITALFCGSQKTLAAGAPMAVAIFASSEQLAQVNPGLLLLPLLCYHPLQLFLAALLLPKLES